MAAAAAAALLDELMGRNRNVGPNEKKVILNWEDSDYCKYYLVKFCPHDLFVNTRADLGACSKIHDDEVKRLFDQSTSHKKLQYVEDFIRFCNNILNDVERKIEKGKQRLLLMNSAENIALTPAQTQRNTEQIALLSEKVNKLVEEAEAAGIQGNVEQAQGLMKLCDQLKDERNALRKQIDNSQFQQTANLASEQEKQMEVCEVCGAFLIVGDAQQRIDDHLMGKQHVGYSKLKKAMEEMVKFRDEVREEREKRRDQERRERYNGTSYTSSSRDYRSSHRDRERRDVRDRSERHRHDSRRSATHEGRREHDHKRSERHSKYEKGVKDRRDKDRDRHRDHKSDREDRGSERRSREEGSRKSGTENGGGSEHGHHQLE